MEALFLLLALIATIWFIYWSAANDTRAKGKPVSGFFAYRPGREPRQSQDGTEPARSGFPDRASPPER